MERLYGAAPYLTTIQIYQHTMLANKKEIIEQPKSSSVSWMNHKLKINTSLVNGTGVFATQKIIKNEQLAVFGGEIITKEEVLALPNNLIPYILQIDDNLWLASGVATAEDTDYFNHSCNPNAGINGQIMLVAMRNIEVGEEITLDYAMAVSQFIGMEDFPCHCGTSQCRKIVSHNDWKSNILQKRYAGYFSLYLQNKITNFFY